MEYVWFTFGHRDDLTHLRFRQAGMFLSIPCVSTHAVGPASDRGTTTKRTRRAEHSDAEFHSVNPVYNDVFVAVCKWPKWPVDKGSCSCLRCKEFQHYWAYCLSWWIVILERGVESRHKRIVKNSWSQMLSHVKPWFDSTWDLKDSCTWPERTHASRPVNIGP